MPKKLSPKSVRAGARGKKVSAKQTGKWPGPGETRYTIDAKNMLRELLKREEERE